jgi:NADPH:quinone reductase-like Zn-dependent oxidoreductase
MATMKAVRIHSYGGPEVLTYEDAPRPSAGAGQVLIRVEAAGVNPVDWKIRDGALQAMLRHRLPLVLGWDVAGVVEAAGPGVTRFKPGDTVFAYLDLSRDGAYAEYAVAAEDEVATKPAAVDFVAAAALPVAALTSWQALFDQAHLAAGQKVLIHAASGGVGSVAVQLARWKGAHVVGTASGRNADFVRRLGADEFIDYTAGRFEDRVRDADVVFDTVGGETQERSFAVLRKGGVLVSIVSPPAPEKAAAHGVRALWFGAQPSGRQLAEVARLVDGGKVRPQVEAVLPLAEARRAHEQSQTGRTRGKIVLRVRGERA